MSDGVLVIDKPAGMTSHDVVDEIRRRFSTRKVGHGGTLDPDATGVLIVGLGRATRFLAYAQAGFKRYRAVARFGITTDTQDASGTVMSEAEPSFGRADLTNTLAAFTGEIQQVPPMVSALKVGGERLYEMARRGEEVERASRTVTVADLTLADLDMPEATLDITCSGGTYVRTLIHDLGRALGCGAHMKSLRRVEAGGFSLSDAVALHAAGPGDLRPLAEAVAALPRLEAGAQEAEDVSHGRSLQIPKRAPNLEQGGVVAVLHGGRLLGVYKRDGDRLTADRVVGA